MNEKDSAAFETILENIIAPVFSSSFFESAEPIARMAIISVFIRTAEFETTTHETCLKIFTEKFTKFLSEIEAESASFDNGRRGEFDLSPVITTACSAFHSMVEWSFGVKILEEHLQQTFFALSTLLSKVKMSIDNDSQKVAATANTVTGKNFTNINDPTAALSLSEKVKACGEILRTIASLFSKLNSTAKNTVTNFDFIAQESKYNSSSSLMRVLLLQTIQITFSDPVIYVRDCQFIAGIVSTWLLKLAYDDMAWIQPVFFNDDLDSLVAEDAALVLLRSEISGALNNTPASLYSLLCFCRGVLSTFGVDCASMNDRQSEKSLLSVMYEKFVFVLETTSDSPTRVFGFQCIASWMIVLRDHLKSTSLPPVGVDIRTVFKQSFNYVFTFWEDPVDSTQHKLKDIFTALLEIISDFKNNGVEDGNLSEFEAERSFLFEIVDNLLKADWLRKVKYDLLAHLLSVITPSELLNLRPDFLTVCFDVMSNLSMSSRICAFLARFFHSLFSGTPPTDPEIWLTPFCYALTHPSPNVRRAVSENLLSVVFKDRKPHFELILQTFQQQQTLSSAHTNNRSPMNAAYKLHGSICVLRVGKSLGFLDGAVFTSKQRSFAAEIVKVGAGHADINIRVDVCGLLCESARTVAEPTKEELELVKMFLGVNGSDHVSEFRQKLFGNLHKLICRIRKCLYANNRDLSVRESRIAKDDDGGVGGVNLDETKKEVSALKEKITLKMDFLKWLMNFA
ncbi:hypothetical protein HK100_000448, partial [Physocladia obscura]